MAEIDSLTIRINAETGAAVAQLKQITSLVDALNTAAKDTSFKSFRDAISGFGRSASTTARGVKELANSLNRVQNMQVSPKLKTNLDKIADASANLSSVGKGVYQFGIGLSKLSKAGESTTALGENLRRVSSHVIDFSQALSRFIPQDFSAKVSSLSKMASAVRSFTKIGEDKDLKTKFKSIADAVGTFATELNNAISDDVLARLERIVAALSQIAQISKEASKALKDLQKINTIQNQQKKNQAADQAKDAIKSWERLVKIIEGVNRLLSEMGSELYGALDSTGILADLDSMSGAISKNIPVLGELTAAWKSAASQVRNIVLSNASVIDKAANLVLVRVSTIIRMLYSLAKVPFTSMGLTKNLVGALASPLKNFIASVGEAKKKWDKFIASLSRVAIYRLIRSALKEISKALKEGVNNLYMWGQAWKDTYSSAARFVETMDSLATAFLYLKNSLGAMVSPLLDYVAPIIDSLIDKFVALTNAINQAMAALSGATVWRRAIKYQYTYAEAANLSTKKAKELKKTVLAFDELNKLDDPNKGNGGSKKEDPDYSKMFEEVPVDNWVKSILDSTSWRVLGTGIANKINEALASINWNSINSNARKWARRLGSLLDGLLMGISMPLLGKSIAEGLNTIASSINTFFKEFHFVELGKHLSAGFMSMINNMSWSEIGTALAQKWKAAMELLIGFKDVDLSGLGKGIVSMISSAIDNLPISDFADAISTLIPKIGTELGVLLNGIFSETNKVMDEIPFGDLGTAFGEGIGNMLDGIDTDEAGKFLTNGLRAIIEFTSTALKSMPWTELNETIGGVIVSAFENIDIKQAVQNALDIATRIVEALTTVVNSIPWEEVGSAIEDSDTTGLKNGIKGLFESVVDGIERAGFMDEVAGGIAAYFALKLGGALAKVLPTALSAKALTSAASGGTAGAAAGGGALATALPEILGFAGAGAIGAALGQQLSHHIIGPILEALGSSDAELYKTWTFFGEDGLFQASIDFAQMKGEEFDTFIKNTTKGISDSFANMGTFIKKTLDGISSNWSNFTDSWSNGFDIIKNGIELVTGADLSGLTDNSKNKGKAKASRITRRASGGTVDKGDLFLAGEAGPEIVTSYGGDTAVMNMDQIISTIAQSVAASQGGDITIPISLDGGLLDKVIITAQQRQSLRSGR